MDRLDYGTRMRMASSGAYKVGYNPSLIYQAHGEMTFEEARAAALAKGRSPAAASVLAAARVAESQHSADRLKLERERQAVEEARSRLVAQLADAEALRQELEREREQIRREREQLEADKRDFQRYVASESERIQRESEALHKRTAENKAPAANHPPNPARSGTHVDDVPMDSEPTMTMTSALAFREIMGMFSGTQEDATGNFRPVAKPTAPRRSSLDVLEIPEIENVRGESEPNSFAVYEDTVELSKGAALQLTQTAKVAEPAPVDHIPLDDLDFFEDDLPAPVAPAKPALPSSAEQASKRKGLGEAVQPLDPFSPECLLKRWLQGSQEASRSSGYYAGARAPGGNLWGGDDSVATKTLDSVIQLADGVTEIEVQDRVGGSSDAVNIHRVERVDDFDADTQSQFALKVHDTTVGELSPLIWEYYVHGELTRRLPRVESRHFVRHHMLCVYPTRCLLLMDYWESRSLQDAVEALSQKGSRMDEILVVYFTIELCKAVERLHEAELLHCALSPNHVLVRVNMGDKTGHWGDWRASQAPGWDDQGVALTDFSNAIDQRAFPAGQRFCGQPPYVDEAFQSPEMRADRPWGPEADHYGLAAIAYYLLTAGRSLTLASSAQTRVPAGLPWDSLQAAPAWRTVFDTLLNGPPVVDSLRDARTALEQFLGQPAKARQVRKLLVALAVQLSGD